ncbi:hypothetical protein B0H13DRAFT_2382348 [Mycena leptocephala]|nr:hypothetical protein B0H13DRAFT_2382348 [Mycena leptocephala]
MAAHTNEKPPKKRGNRGDFHGLRLEFLTVNQERYSEASRKSKTPEFWRRLFNAYWRLFPWRVALTADQIRGEGAEAIQAIGPLDEDEVEVPVLRESLGEEETKAKQLVVQQTEKKIKSWYNYRRNATGLTGNLFSALLKSLRPPEFKGRVQEEFVAHGYGERPASLHISLRCKVAQDVLADESAEVKARIKEEANEEYQELLVEHNAAMEGLPSVREEDQALARECLAAIVTPLLLLLREYTGYNFTLLAGRVDRTGPKPEFQVTGIHAGTATKVGKDAIFPVWDPKVYESTLNLFTKFVWAADQPSQPDPDSNDLPTSLLPTPATTENSAREPDANSNEENDARVLESRPPAGILEPALERQIAAIEDTEENGTKRKAAAKAVGQRKRGTREQEEGNSSEDDSVDESDVPAAPRPPRPVRAAALKTRTTAAATPSKTFHALVQKWWDYEAGSGFMSQAGGQKAPSAGQGVGGKSTESVVYTVHPKRGAIRCEWQAWWIELNLRGAKQTYDGKIYGWLVGRRAGGRGGRKIKGVGRGVTDVSWVLDRLNGKPVHLAAKVSDAAPGDNIDARTTGMQPPDTTSVPAATATPALPAAAPPRMRYRADPIICHVHPTVAAVNTPPAEGMQDPRRPEPRKAHIPQDSGDSAGRAGSKDDLSGAALPPPDQISRGVLSQSPEFSQEELDEMQDDPNAFMDVDGEGEGAGGDGLLYGDVDMIG